MTAKPKQFSVFFRLLVLLFAVANREWLGYILAAEGLVQGHFLLLYFLFGSAAVITAVDLYFCCICDSHPIVGDVSSPVSALYSSFLRLVMLLVNIAAAIISHILDLGVNWPVAEM